MATKMMEAIVMGMRTTTEEALSALGGAQPMMGVLLRLLGPNMLRWVFNSPFKLGFLTNSFGLKRALLGQYLGFARVHKGFWSTMSGEDMYSVVQPLLGGARLRGLRGVNDVGDGNGLALPIDVFPMPWYWM